MRYTLTHEGDKIGTSSLESGDPSILAVSGMFLNTGGAKAMAGFLKSIGGKEDQGVFFVELTDAFKLYDEDRNAITFSEGNLIAIPADEEVFLDIVGLSEADYEKYFPGHLAELADNA